MFKKYVKDRNHNKYPAYCCEDIDGDLGARVKALEEALEGLVAGIMPDGSVTLAKLADDARSYTREINKGRLLSEWVGTQEEYAEHLAANGGSPLPNVRYSVDSLAWETIEAPQWDSGEAADAVSIVLNEGQTYIFDIFCNIGNCFTYTAIMTINAAANAIYSNDFKIAYIAAAESGVGMSLYTAPAFLIYTKADKKLYITTEKPAEIQGYDYTVRYAKIA